MARTTRSGPPRTAVISWIDHHPRSSTIAAELEGEAVFMPWARPRMAPPRRVVSWLRSAVRTVRVVRALPAGSVIVVMAPPVFAPAVAEAVRRRGVAVAVDIHSGAFNDARWRWSFGLMARVARRCDLALITNTEILRGVDLGDIPVRLLHGPIGAPRDDRPAGDDRRSDAVRPSVVYPASGSADEPLDAVVDAAAELAGEVDVVVTGRIALVGSHAIHTTGYLPRPDYEALLHSADVVLALTTREATMQAAGYEALTAGRPIVSSDTAVLRDALGAAAVYVRPDGPSIAAGIREALACRADLCAAGSTVLAAMNADAARVLAEVRHLAPRVR